jgi:hypothetical protein
MKQPHDYGRSRSGPPPVFGLLVCLACLGAGVVLPAAAQSGTSSFSVNGSLETLPYAAYSGTDDFSGSFSCGSATKFDLELTARGPSAAVQASAGASLEADLYTGAAVGAFLAANQLGEMPADLILGPATSGGSTPEALTAAQVRTAWAKLDWGWASLQAGRQVLSYGRGAWWSPEDIYTRVELSGISSLKLGSDALRLRLPFGDTGMLDAAAAPTANPADGTYSMRLSGLPVSGLDLGAIAGYSGGGGTTTAGAGYSGAASFTSGLGGCMLAGGDFKLDLGASFYGEALWLGPDDGAPGLFRSAFGLDWSFGDFYVAAEYYYNGGVASNLDPYFAGTHNVYGNISWKTTPFVTMIADVLWDVTDAEGIGLFVVSADVAQNAVFSAFAELSRNALSTAPLMVMTGIDLLVKF